MKAIILTGKFATDSEVVYPMHRLREAGYDVDIAVRGNQMVLSDLGGKIVPTMDIPLSVYKGYKVLILPGGAKAMEYMRQDKQIIDYIAAFHALGKPIGCICHGAQLLISAGLVRGRRISGYYSVRDDITNAGGTYDDCEAPPHYASQDGITTTSHYKWLGPWMAAVIKSI